MRSALRWSDLEIDSEIGSGQAGVVVRARLRKAIGGLRHGEAVAVKKYKPWVLEEPGQFERIFRELEIGRTVTHPHLVTCIGVVADEAGHPALVMKYYEGQTLETFLEARRADGTPIEFETAVDILRRVASALGALHDAGFIHRDVKPANVMLTPSGAVLMDLGVVSSREFAEGTTTSNFLGTIRYAAPEYLFGKAYDYRVDVYSLGALAYELLLGKQFDGEIQHWAELVAKRRIDNSFSWDGATRGALSERLGLSRLEFFLGVLENSLTEPESRQLDLRALEIAIRDRYWDEQFQLEEGRFALGPPQFTPLGDFSDNVPHVSLSEILEELRHRLTKEEQILLRRLARERYWESNWLVNDWREVEQLVLAGALKKGWVTEFQTGALHAAVRYAHRYGIL